jgi:hypothetical protein
MGGQCCADSDGASSYQSAFVLFQVFNRQIMQLLVLSESLNNVPAQSIDIHPPTLHPAGLRCPQELDQSIVIQLVYQNVVLGEVYNRYLALGVQLRRGCAPAIGLGRVDPRLRARLPSRPHIELLEILDGLDRVSTRIATSQPSNARKVCVGSWDAAAK